MNRYQKCALLVLVVCFVISARIAGDVPSSNDKLGGDFTLTDHKGKSFQLQSQRGKIVLLYFGYTTCTEACPTMLATVARAYRVLGDSTAQVQFLLLSVDPQRDTPEKMKSYLDYFRVNALGLTGTKAAIDKVVKQYGARYEMEKSDSALGYHISHTTDLYLIDQQGKLRHRFKHNDSSNTIAAGVKELLAEKTRGKL